MFVQTFMHTMLSSEWSSMSMKNRFELGILDARDKALKVYKTRIICYFTNLLLDIL